MNTNSLRSLQSIRSRVKRSSKDKINREDSILFNTFTQICIALYIITQQTLLSQATYLENHKQSHAISCNQICRTVKKLRKKKDMPLFNIRFIFVYANEMSRMLIDILCSVYWFNAMSMYWCPLMHLCSINKRNNDSERKALWLAFRYLKA